MKNAHHTKQRYSVADAVLMLIETKYNRSTSEVKRHNKKNQNDFITKGPLRRQKSQGGHDIRYTVIQITHSTHSVLR